ncbi:MAG: cysteine hydrolase [Rhodospirillales bacterium]|nr:cysteine hydrolase [Rhodospirillales bacterium]
MHPFTIPPEISARVAARCGTPHPFATLVGPRTALVVVDMQNAFMDPALGHAVCAMAPAIVPVVNRLATATRAAGGGVFWIQTVHDETDDRDWAVMQAMMTPAARARRVAALTRDSAGYALWPGMDVRPEDERVEKHRFSAFIQGSGALEARLRARDFDTVLITGTVTSVCCESTARDAMMRDFRTVMVSDGNAATSDSEHEAALLGFHAMFGDVLTVTECEAGFAAGAKEMAA